nr:MAG TPA: hypothetical protein [Caudoviricetes sp.]
MTDEDKAEIEVQDQHDPDDVAAPFDPEEVADE